MTTTNGQDSRHRATAVRHALALEEKKKLKSRILDLVLEAYDLPSRTISLPTQADATDVQLFKTCLSLFQPSDFDDLVRERNIDDRCGYALCSNSNKRLASGDGKVWNHKGGREFKIVDRADLERWCSTECGQRAAFARAQLSTEPAWLRDPQTGNIRLLDEMPTTDDLVEAVKDLTISGAANDDLNARLKALSFERGDPKSSNGSSIAIVEKNTDTDPNEPPELFGEDLIEGHRPT